MAAELIEAGVDVHDTYRRLYERVPIEKLRLISRALAAVERYDEGRLAVTYISSEDYAAANADEVLTEGVIDFVRSLEGALLAAVIRDKTDGGAAARKVSLRSRQRLDRRLGDRPQARRWGARTRCGLLHRFALRRARGGASCRALRRLLSRPRRASSWSTSRRARRPTTSSPAPAASAARRPATPARWTPSRPAS